MSHDYDDAFNSGCTQIVEATFNYRGVAEGKQRLERAHAARAPGSEKDRRYLIFGLWTLVFELWWPNAHVDEGDQRSKTEAQRPCSSFSARSVYCRVISLRQFITKSVLSSGRALL